MNNNLPANTTEIKCAGGYSFPDIPFAQLGHDVETGLKMYRFQGNDVGWKFATNVPSPFYLPTLADYAAIYPKL